MLSDVLFNEILGSEFLFELFDFLIQRRNIDILFVSDWRKWVFEFLTHIEKLLFGVAERRRFELLLLFYFRLQVGFVHRWLVIVDEHLRSRVSHFHVLLLVLLIIYFRLAWIGFRNRTLLFHMIWEIVVVLLLLLLLLLQFLFIRINMFEKLIFFWIHLFFCQIMFEVVKIEQLFILRFCRFWSNLLLGTLFSSKLLILFWCSLLLLSIVVLLLRLLEWIKLILIFVQELLLEVSEVIVDLLLGLIWFSSEGLGVGWIHLFLREVFVELLSVGFMSRISGGCGLPVLSVGIPVLLQIFQGLDHLTFLLAQFTFESVPNEVCIM